MSKNKKSTKSKVAAERKHRGKSLKSVVPNSKSDKGLKKPIPARKSNSYVNGFPIVGIGASAGGLEAFTQLLETLPVDTGMAFIFVQHLDPSHHSMSSEIFSRNTKMPVHEVENGMCVAPNHVYINPPNFSMTILDGCLSLLPRAETRGQHLTIDFFFQSLALDQKERAVGVVLSGAASDGTQGLKAIKADGGLTIAQDPKTAKYDGMPKSAIASGIIDFILPLDGIAQELARIAEHPYIAAACKANAGAEMESDDQTEGKDDIQIGSVDALRKIFVLLRTHTQIDFSNYKPTTLKRRIQRRMMVRKTESLDDYAKYLQDHNDEIKSLFADILINVTEFFRDPESFKALTESVFPKLMKNRHGGSAIRIWVAGCSTGEEAYSIAISIVEFLGNGGTKIPIQVFATDISESAIQKARAGVYPEGIERSVSKERLKRFFDRVDGGYKINKSIRDLCLFSKHDVTSDPPFSKLDLVTCRNVLIYFAAILQKHVIPVFHYALNPDGFLFLGRSDSPGGSAKLFTIVDKANKIYSKTNVPTPMTFRFPASAYVPEVQDVIPKVNQHVKRRSDFQIDADRIAVIKYAPPFVVVNTDLEILQFRGRTFPYLEPASGLASNHLLKMARPELLQGLRMTIQVATKQNTHARQEGLSFVVDGKRRTVNIEVIPANPLASPGQRNFVIFFEEAIASTPRGEPKGALRGKQTSKKAPAGNILDRQSQRISLLEQDALANKQYQQSMTEEFEAAQEELTSANEELQSTNEELQSTNEEMETAKEETQSSNEELTTVNDELQSRNSELALFSSDLSNVLSSVDIPILIVGNDHRIRRFTPKAEKVFRLIPSDVGRPIDDIKNEFNLDLDALIAEVIKSLIPHQKEIKDRQGRWMRLQIRPYKTIDNRIDGAVITLMDIEALKQQVATAKRAQDYLTSVAETVSLPLVILDDQLLLRSANLSFWEHFRLSQQITGKDFFAILEMQSTSAQEMRKLLTETLNLKKKIKNVEMDCEFPQLGRRTFLISASLIQWMGELSQEPQEPQEPQSILLSFDDITERKRTEENLQQLFGKEKAARSDSERANQTKDEFIATLSHELRTPLTSILSWSQIIQKQNIDPDKIKHGIMMIEKSAKMQRQLIDDLLDVTRIRSGKLSIIFSEVDPREPVSNAIEAVQPLAESKKIVIKSEIKIQSEKIWGDQDRLQQIVWNLLTNAIKFSTEGAVVLVRVEQVEVQGDQFVSIKVIDQGKGIASEFVPNLFERFSQADSSSVRVHGGLGLGLAIVRDLVQLQEGCVRAESDGKGKGATFTILLPIKLGAACKMDEASARPEIKIQNNVEPVDLSGLRILVVDDDPITLEVLIETLSSFGAKTHPCSSVANALAALEKFRPDILVSDIAMPVEDGYSLIRKVRKLDMGHYSNLPALALTAYATDSDVKTALSAGFDSHMAKPFDTHRLGQAVTELVRQKKVGRSET